MPQVNEISWLFISLKFFSSFLFLTVLIHFFFNVSLSFTHPMKKYNFNLFF